MLGALAGDLIGSRFEGRAPGLVDFDPVHPDCRFTDDSVLTIATAEALLGGGDFAGSYRRWARRYPRAGYGRSFRSWFRSDSAGPYGSYANGAAMRVSPVAYTWDQDGAASAAVTHDHPDGIESARAVVSAIRLALAGLDAERIERFLTSRYPDLVWEVQPFHRFDLRGKTSVPTALLVGLRSPGWEQAVREAVALGGDVDTVACIAGSVAEALHGGVPAHIAAWVEEKLDQDMRAVLRDFTERHVRPALDDTWPARAIDPGLLDAYENTVLEVDLDGDTCPVSGEAPLPEALRPGCWIVSAWNPDSVKLDPAVNEARHRALLEVALASGLTHHPALGRSASGDWRETSLAIVGAGEAEVLRWGRLLGQLAVFRIGEHVDVVPCFP